MGQARRSGNGYLFWVTSGLWDYSTGFGQGVHSLSLFHISYLTHIQIIFPFSRHQACCSYPTSISRLQVQTWRQ
jgi:hypothetical protein